jgi:hypothetical protein
MKMESFHGTILPPLVIPAQAGIQVCFGELAWIPAFAGMTEPNRYPASCYHSEPVLSKEDTKATKVFIGSARAPIIARAQRNS